MKDNKETLEEFEENANNLLDSLKAFAPSIEAMKGLADVDLTDEAKEIVDQFTQKGEGLDMEGLIRLKKEYLQKLGNVTK